MLAVKSMYICTMGKTMITKKKQMPILLSEFVGMWSLFYTITLSSLFLNRLEILNQN